MTQILEPPCAFCGYNGPRYWQTKSHDERCPWYNIPGDIGRQKRLRHAIQQMMALLYLHKTKLLAVDVWRHTMEWEANEQTAQAGDELEEIINAEHDHAGIIVSMLKRRDLTG